MFHALTVVIPEGPAAEIRRLAHARERGNQRNSALVNQPLGLVAIIWISKCADLAESNIPNTLHRQLKIQHFRLN